MKSNLTLALSEFSKGHWAIEPPEPPLHPTKLSLAARAWSWLSKLASLTLARYLITFFVGIVATLVWQSYRDVTKEGTVAAAPVGLESVRQSIDKLAAEIANLKAVEQHILENISTPSRPVTTPARNPAQRPSPVR